MYIGKKNKFKKIGIIPPNLNRKIKTVGEREGRSEGYRQKNDFPSLFQ
jgi:hypothetical protein